MSAPRRIVVGLSGASGAIYGIRALEVIRQDRSVELHLIVSSGAKATIAYETTRSYDEVIGLADVVHDEKDLAASLASGTFLTAGMLVAPCSMRTMAAIANALDDNLIVRAADVHLKERRKLVLMVRETPLNLAHLRNMTAVTEMGGIVFPPLPAFYHRPTSVDEIVDDTVERVLALIGVEQARPKAWTGL